MATKGRLGFRSDTRHPDKIFETGFVSNDIVGYRPDRSRTTVRAAYRLSEYVNGRGAREAADLYSNKVVALSVRTSAAALFPWEDKTAASWLYMCFVPEAEVFYTRTKEVEESFMKAQAGDPKAPWWAIYTHEFAVKAVRPHHVMAAVPIIRDRPSQYLLGSMTGSCRDDGPARDAKENLGAIAWNCLAFQPFQDASGSCLDDQETWRNPSNVGLPRTIRIAGKAFFEKQVSLSVWQTRALPESGWEVAV